MRISHNMQALNSIRLVNVNIESFAKSTEKVSSGYRVNRAADDPAGLSISEVLRRQIKGLTQAVNNTKDGVAFVQTADGAMEEIHSMLQRMNELTVKALHGIYSDSDRAAMDAELDQYRTEIDRINHTTEFGTGFPVFEEHEPSYYKICGNKRWNDNQLHIIPSMGNELNIRLPEGYEPKEYTITVPPGTYTTQELVDEIDDALSKMVPPNPGFVFEFTSDGYCNLLFEKADGTPTKIDFVDGSLAYLIYEFRGGSGSASILGTTVFGIGQALTVVQGQNDTLGFYMESITGTNYVTITIPPDDYTHAQMIDIINEKLGELAEKDPNIAGIVAKEYEGNCIQLTGGDKINIIGLKGNMFKYEDRKKAETLYYSAFYDNVNYGFSNKTAAYIRGNSYDTAIPITIDDSNNILRVKLNGSDKYTEITLTKGEYTNILSLADMVKEKVQGKGLSADVSYDSSTGGYCLRLSSTLKGTQSRLEFDTTEGTVFNETYKTLFLGTSRLPSVVTGYPATLIGLPVLSGKITLEKDASLSLSIGGKPYTIDGIGGAYDNLDDLVTVLNDKIKDSELKSKITFAATSDGKLSVTALTNDVSIDVGNRNDTYKTLFTIDAEKVNDGRYTPTSGSITKSEQGFIQTVRTDATVSVTIPSDMRTTPVTIDATNNQLRLSYVNTSGTVNYETITLNSREYSNISELVADIQNILKEKGETNEYLAKTKVEYRNGTITFTSTPIGNQTGTWSVGIPSGDRSSLETYVWRTILGTKVEKAEPSLPKYGQTAQLYSYLSIPFPITVDKNNNVLTVDLDGKSVTIDLLEGYGGGSKVYNKEDFLTVLRNKLGGSGITPSINGSGGITLTALNGTFSASGSFYEKAIIRKFVKNPTAKVDGTYSFEDAFVTGSKDLTVAPIEIVSGTNDKFIFDFTHNGEKTTISVTIPAGTYSGESLAEVLDKLVKKKFAEKGLNDFEVTIGIGTNDIEVTNMDSDKALHITVTNAAGKEPEGMDYVVDGVRGNSACYVFYKTNDTPKATYILGTKNIWEGVSFEPGKNVLTLTANSVPYKYTFDKPYYTAQEFLDTLNNMFERGDDNGNPAFLKASIENGVLKISHKSIGANTITDIGGSGRGAIFFEEEGRDSRDPLLIHVGSEAYQNTEIPRISVSSVALNINSITLSKQKYAEKANVRIKDAIKLLSSKRSTYGAIQNRLEHTIVNNETVIDRVQESESRIRDTDLSSEMIRYSNLSILLRMGSTMIAESNKRIDRLMTLLQ